MVRDYHIENLVEFLQSEDHNLMLPLLLSQKPHHRLK